MASTALIDQLDTAINALMAEPETSLPADPEVASLLSVAAGLRALPRPGFKTRLKADLMEQAGVPVARLVEMPHRDDILPTLFGDRNNEYAVNRRNFVASFLAHTAMIALVATSGFWMVQHQQVIKNQVVQLVAPEISPYVPAPGKDQLAGGGGGGDRDKMLASKGSLPKFALEQITPPAIVIRNEHPKLTVDPSVVVPPQVNMARIMPNLGDPTGVIPNGPPSNGTGSGGGLGSGTGGGVGSGIGPGVGPGIGGGMAGGVFKVGGGVSAPRGIYTPDPQYSDEARKAKYQGTVTLWLIVGADGRPRDVKVARSLGMGLDQKAVEAVRTWKFEPALKDGHPVAVQINVEVNFRLY